MRREFRTKGTQKRIKKQKRFTERAAVVPMFSEPRPNKNATLVVAEGSDLEERREGRRKAKGR